VAAAIANGTALVELGPRLDAIKRLRYEPPSYGDVVPAIVVVDRFGNAITDIERAKIPFAMFALRVRDHVIDRVERNSAMPRRGVSHRRVDRRIEISVANASAAERLQLRRLERVEVTPL
jgi:S-adenosylmethionine hydrolase